jgi:hypothetical protein
MASMDGRTKSDDVDASYVVVCTKCKASETSEYGSYDIKARFISHIELNGWRHRRAGWVCGDCRNDEKAVK